MNYDPGLFLADIATVPFHVAHIFDDPEDVCWAWSKLLSDALDVHAPVQFSSVLYFSNWYYLQNWTCQQVADANLGGHVITKKE